MSGCVSAMPVTYPDRREQLRALRRLHDGMIGSRASRHGRRQPPRRRPPSVARRAGGGHPRGALVVRPARPPACVPLRFKVAAHVAFDLGEIFDIGQTALDLVCDDLSVDFGQVRQHFRMAGLGDSFDAVKGSADAADMLDDLLRNIRRVEPGEPSCSARPAQWLQERKGPMAYTRRAPGRLSAVFAQGTLPNICRTARAGKGHPGLVLVPSPPPCFPTTPPASCCSRSR